jgi:putative (di)nucleoside polyphosphate hydrolase
MDLIDKDGYRSNVGIILIASDRRVLIAGRRGRSGWQFPQGGVQLKESVEDAMYRELHEEIGLQPHDVSVAGATEDWIRYRLPEKYIRWEQQPVCVGQKQRWFLLNMRAQTSQLRFDATDEPEFDRYQWVDYWRPVKEVIYFKRPVYVRVLTELGPLAFPEAGPPPRPAWWPQRWSKAPD